MAADTDSSAVGSLLDALTKNVDTVENTLEPLLEHPLTTASSKLPLLDKAKLYVHTAYAIESLLFSHLRLSGADAKSHPIFAELGRVRAYFQKIKSAEDIGPTSRLDKAAANRFIKHALSGNDAYDRKRDESGAKRKHDDLADRYGTSNRFAATSKRMKETEHTETGPSDESEQPASKTAADGSPWEKSKKKKGRHSSGSAKEEKQSSRYKKKSHHAPKDAHQAFQKLIGKDGGSK